MAAEHSLGKASLELDSNIEEFERDMRRGGRSADEMQRHLDRLEAQSKLTDEALQSIRMRADQAAETKGVSEQVKRALAAISHDAEDASDHLRDVKLGEAQAAESEVASARIQRTLNAVTRHANEARRALVGARLAGAGAGAGGGGGFGGGKGRNPGAGFGPFGSGFGRVGVLGAAVGAGTILGPTAGPGALGLLASIPTLAASGAGALGTLILGFQGVGKAISGDKKAYDELQPSQQKFVLTVRSLTGWVDKLKETAGESMFPGLTEGLRSALSPGTLSAITKAVTQFGTAIGQAGAQWGKYFGSAQFQQIFGPLMEAGAKTLTTLSGAALSLFDALGVLGRAAIPLTTWLTETAARGARFIDTFVRAQDASGGLAHAMDEARSSLQIVGGLVESLARVAAALGEALYPVSKIAVKDLTDGLNALAGMIDRNQGKIQEIVGGALAALRSTIENLTPVAQDLAKALDWIAQSVGGWDVAFQVVIAGVIAKSLIGIGTAAGEAGAAGKVGLLGTRLSALGALGTIGITIEITRLFLDKYGDTKVGGTKPLKYSGIDLFNDFRDVTGTIASKIPGVPTPSGTQAHAAGARGTTHLTIDPVTGKVSQFTLGTTVSGARKLYDVTQPGTHPVIPGAVSGSSTVPYWQMPPGYGDAMPAWTKNLGSAAAKPTSPAMELLSGSFKAAALGGPFRAAAALRDRELGLTGGPLTLADVNKAVTENQRAAADRRNAAATRQAMQLLDLNQAGPAALRGRERSLLTGLLTRRGADPRKLAGLGLDDLLDRATPLLSKASLRSLHKVNEVLELASKRVLDPSVLNNVQARLQQFNDTVTASFAGLGKSGKEIARQNERDFLAAFASIQSRFAPNTTSDGGGIPGLLATHAYNQTHESRKQTRAMEKVANRIAAQASDYVLQLGFA